MVDFTIIDGDVAMPCSPLCPVQMALKCADISNQTRLWDLCQNWSLRIMEEFFRQGDAERDLHLPISFLCDRHSVCVPDSQKGWCLVHVCVCVCWHSSLANQKYVLVTSCCFEKIYNDWGGGGIVNIEVGILRASCYPSVYTKVLWECQLTLLFCHMD